MHLIATTLFCKIIFYVQHFLSMLDFIFFSSYNGLCGNNKHTRKLLKKEGVAEKREKMALFTENYQEEMMHILKDMAHVRISGTKEEADCAIYLQECCKKMGFETSSGGISVEMCDIHEAVLTVDGKEIPCKGYRCAGSGTVEAPFYYMPNTDACSLAQCKGKIVMLDGGVGYWSYRDLIENGAVGIITYDGNANYADEDIDLRELRSFVREGSDNKKSSLCQYQCKICNQARKSEFS